MCGVLISIARYNLFDIDRLISGTASYTGALVLIALFGETVFEPFAGAMAATRRWDRCLDDLFVARV